MYLAYMELEVLCCGSPSQSDFDEGPEPSEDISPIDREVHIWKASTLQLQVEGDFAHIDWEISTKHLVPSFDPYRARPARSQHGGYLSFLSGYIRHCKLFS